MKKSLITFCLFCTALCSYAQTVNIPDANFKGTLIGKGVDTNTNGEIEVSEALAVTSLNVSFSFITNLTGIEAFTNLTLLNCSSNELTSLDVSNNTALTRLYCHWNQLTSLDVSDNLALTTLTLTSNNFSTIDLTNNTALDTLVSSYNPITSLNLNSNAALTYLDCSANMLTTLDVSNNTALITLWCGGNQLSSLDVSNNTALTSLLCGENQISFLDVTNNTSLLYLQCYSNPLNVLDVSNNTALLLLECSGNQLTTLDISSNVALTELYCYNNQLTTLNISNNTALGYLFCFNNQLTCMDVSNNALIYLSCQLNPTLPQICINSSQVSLSASWVKDAVATWNSNLSCECGPVCPAAPTVMGNVSCQHTQVTLAASGGVPGQYRWYTTENGGTPDAAQQTESFATPILTQTTSYWVSIDDGTCESPRTEVIATVLPLPAAPTAQQATAICSGTNTTLIASGTTDGNYRWYDGQTLITGQVKSTLAVNNIVASKTYNVSIFDGTCESAKTPINITVQNCTPPVVASATATTFIEGLVVIDLQELISDPEDNIDPSRIHVTSDPISGARAEIIGFELQINYAGLPFVGSDQVGIEVCDLTDLCTAQTLTIELGGTIKVYNAVSPNGDGKNDFLTIQYIDILPETQSNNVILYNRWGDEVFSVSDYNNADRVFKGDNKNGNKLPTGTYFYKIVFPNGKKTLTGFLELKY